MMTLLLAWLIGSCLVIGYVIGRGHEQSIYRRNRQRRVHYVQPLPSWRGAGPQLPNINKRYVR